MLKYYKHPKNVLHIPTEDWYKTPKKVIPPSFFTTLHLPLYSVGMGLAPIRLPTTRFLGQMEASSIPTEEFFHSCLSPCQDSTHSELLIFSYAGTFRKKSGSK
jgi:hypothetical protein